MSASLVDVKFIGLLAALILIRPCVPGRWYAVFGALSSAALIGLASPPTLLIVAGVTLGYLYPLHLISLRARRRGANRNLSKTWVLLGLAGLIALMVVFKAHRAFTVPFLTGNLVGRQLAAIIGFSYFFFRAYNFLYIQHVLDLEDKSPWGLLFFVLFPPTLTSGPIHRYPDFKQQLSEPQPLNTNNMVTGLYRITRGYFRKICLAYVCQEALTALLAVPSPNAYTSILVIVAQYLYFYYDFAGYSDIAIGFGMLLGIKVPENFKKPFLATSIAEFWRNWHITLMSWFRDHVFFPLGGARSRNKAVWLVLMIMILCGLWHGFGFMFVAWGLCHGIMLAVEHLLGARPIPPAQRRGFKYWTKVVWTNVRVGLAMAFFLPDPASLQVVLLGFTRWM